MRKITVEVPEKTCVGCDLMFAKHNQILKSSRGGTFYARTCSFRRGRGVDTNTARPVKACRDAEVKHG